MGVKINSFGLVVTGEVRRVHDRDTGQTTLDLNAAQCREAYESLGEVLRFFNEHGDGDSGPQAAAPTPNPDEPELPLDAPEIPEIDASKIKVGSGLAADKLDGRIDPDSIPSMQLDKAKPGK